MERGQASSASGPSSRTPFIEWTRDPSTRLAGGSTILLFHGGTAPRGVPTTLEFAAERLTDKFLPSRRLCPEKAVSPRDGPAGRLYKVAGVRKRSNLRPERMRSGRLTAWRRARWSLA